MIQTPERAVIRYFLVICASFLVLMNALCMTLRPQLFDHPHWGISYFGSQRVTLLPYYLGFGIIVFCLIRVTQLLSSAAIQLRPVRTIFLISTIVTASIGMTSSMSDAFLYWTHIYLSLVLLLLIIGAEIWVLMQPGTYWIDYVGLAFVVIGGVVVVLSSSWAGKLGLYALGEMLVFLGAFTCLGRAALRAVSE